jgi:hypothetical protein
VITTVFMYRSCLRATWTIAAAETCCAVTYKTGMISSL